MEKYIVVDGRNVTVDDIAEAVSLDKLVYDEEYYVTIRQCLDWYSKNDRIYTMIKESDTNRTIAYVNASPVTSEYYNKIRGGEFIDTYLPPDAIVGYDFPDLYNLYFSSIVVHPDYQNTAVFLALFNAITQKFLELGRQGILIKSIVADAVSKKGEKFCRLFGMEKVKNSTHDSEIFEVQMVPPEFRVSSKATKQLYDFYASKAADLGIVNPIAKERADIIRPKINERVFISYSTQDANMALKVCDYLETNGIGCWIAPRNINPGDNYATQIVHAIRDSAALVLVASESTNASGHVSNEVSLAFDNKKLIVPFKIERFTFSDEYLYFLGRKLWIEAYQNIDNGLIRLRDTLCSNLIISNKKTENTTKEEGATAAKKETVQDSPKPIQSETVSKAKIAESVLKTANMYFHNSMGIFKHHRSFEETKKYANRFLKQTFTVSKYNRCIEVDNLIDYLVEEISGDSESEVVKITGMPGSAKSVLMQTAFYEILSDFKSGNGVFLPFYISLEYYESLNCAEKHTGQQVKTIIYNDMSDFLSYIGNSDGVLPVLFADGVREHNTGKISLDNILMEIVEDSNILKRVISIDTDVIKNRSRLKRIIPLVTGKISVCFEAHAVDSHNEGQAKDFIKNLVAFNNYDIDPDDVFKVVKKLKYHEIDAFIVHSLSKELINSGRNLISISDIYERWALTEFRGNENILASVAEKTFAYVFQRGFNMESVTFNAPQWRLIHKHRSFLDMLVARHVIYEIDKYGENTDFDCSIFDIMLTASSDRFLSDYLKENYALQEKVLSLITNKFDDMSIEQQSSSVFLLAKITYKNLIADVLNFLRPKFNVLKPVVKKSDNTTQDNYDNQFVFRAICFTLATFGQIQVLDDYLCLLITNDSAHAINRGAIVEYYNDQHQMAANGSYYLDTDLKLGGKAINALIWKINKNLQPGGRRYPELDLVTLASLIQMRIQTNQSQRIPEICAWVREFLSAIEKYKIMPQHIKSEKIEFYFSSMCDDFQAFLDFDGDFDISQIMYNTLKGLKDTKRKQWTKKNIYDPESVSEHLYNAWMLAMLFLPQETNYEEYSKKEILDMLLIHDMAEAKLGDVILELNEPSKELREQNSVMRKMFVKGSYPNIANLTYYYNIWTGYYKGLNINSKIARDINLIQTVYTFCEYCVKYPEKFDAEEISRWMSEKDRLETDVGFSIYDKLVENNRSFDVIFRKEAGARTTAHHGIPISSEKKTQPPQVKRMPEYAVKTLASDYRIMSCGELQISNANIDSIKCEISNIVSSAIAKENNVELDENLAILENVSENWRVILNEKDELVGYWVFVALPDDMFKEAKLGRLAEKDITLDTMEYIDFPGTYNGYLLMSGIKPGARTSSLVRLLYESLARHIEALAQKGIYFREILCVAQSASGRSAIKKMGLVEISKHTYGGQVFSVDMTNVRANKYFSSFEVLKNLYCDYFENNC